MKSWWGRSRIIGPMLAFCGVALLVLAAQRQPISSQLSAVINSAPAIVATPSFVADPATATATGGETPAAPTSPDLVSAIPTTSATPVARGSPPTRLSIPSVGLDEPIVEVSAQAEVVSGQRVLVWNVADYAVGHNDTSAEPGQGGNVVLTGHDDWHGEVFRDLHSVVNGDKITVTTKDGVAHQYVVTYVLYRLEVGVPIGERLKTAQLIGPTADEQLTLVTCWPYGVDDHRLIVIARPAA